MAKKKLDSFAERAGELEEALARAEQQLQTQLAEINSEVASWHPELQELAAECLRDEFVETRRLIGFLRRLSAAGREHHAGLEGAKSARREGGRERARNAAQSRQKRDLELRKAAEDIRASEPHSRDRSTNWLAQVLAAKLSGKPQSIRKRLNALKIR